MTTYVVKEREFDTESVRSGHGHRHVRRYKVSDDRERTVERVYDDDDIRSVRSARTVQTSRGEGDREEIRITRREVKGGDRDDERDVVSYRVVDRHKSRSRSSSSSSSSRRSRRREEKITIKRDVGRSPSPERERVREYRYERDRDDRYRDRPYDVERVTKSTEYYSRPEPIVIRESVPQPIIIREEAPRQEIIIKHQDRSRSRSRSRSKSSSRSRAPSRAASRAGTTVIERKSVVEEEQALIPIPIPVPAKEDYYYERVTREVDGADQHHRRRRRRHRKHRSRSGSRESEEDVKYVRREVKEYDVRDSDPHTKRHLAEGAVVGLGAAALMRSRSRKRGENPGHRGRQALGYAAAGAIGAEALARVKRHYDRSRSQEREVEEYYEDRDGNRHDVRRHRSKSRRRGSRSRSRSRSGSSHHGKRNTVLAVAGIAAAAAAAYAAGKRNKDTTVIEDRRSRSRHRAGSVSGVSERSLSRGAGEGVHQDPQHRKRRIAQAGLAGAAIAGLAEHHRDKSRGRSKSRVRQAIPVVAAGLGTAAVAGIYEKFKAKKEAKRSQSRPGEYGRSRSRSVGDRTHSVGASSRRTAGDGALIEYGGDPIYSEHRGRSGSRRRDGSRERSRSRFKDVATGAAVAGATGLALNEAKKRREAKRAEKERRRREDEAANEHDNYYDPMQYYPSNAAFPPPPQTGPSPFQQNAYPPPPSPGHHLGNGYHDAHNGYASQPNPYNPADYGPQTGPTLPEHYYQGQRDIHSPTQDYYGAGGGHGPPPQHRQGSGGPPPPHQRENPENVSATVVLPPHEPGERARAFDDGLDGAYDVDRSGASTPRGVKFDLPSPTPVTEMGGPILGYPPHVPVAAPQFPPPPDPFNDRPDRPRRRRDRDADLNGGAGLDRPLWRGFAPAPSSSNGAGNAPSTTGATDNTLDSRGKDHQRHRRREHDRSDPRRDRDRSRNADDRGSRRDGGSTRGGDRGGSNRSRRGHSPSGRSDGSGETTDLPPRFDDRGRRLDDSGDGGGAGDGSLSGLLRGIVAGVFEGRK